MPEKKILHLCYTVTSVHLVSNDLPAALCLTILANSFRRSFCCFSASWSIQARYTLRTNLVCFIALSSFGNKTVTQVYMKNQEKNCDKEKRALGLFSTGYGSSDHLILCPVELFTKCFMTIVLLLTMLRLDPKTPNTNVDVCPCLETQVQLCNAELVYPHPWLPMCSRQNHVAQLDDCGPQDQLSTLTQVDCRSNDPLVFVFRNRGYGVQARWASLQPAFTCGPRRCVPRVGRTGSKTSSRHSLLQWLEQETLSCFDL